MLGAIKSLDCIRKDDVNECASQIVDRIKQHRCEPVISAAVKSNHPKTALSSTISFPAHET